ncbi:wax ester/triacylglycerol synthase family O-acyltransferase [Microbacterium sp. QXD-8]|uniref:Wax ester/triacylglycerol synthase family O-acyltransferase n=1 Tax=Microbacterium psychrotolerans TaxID=3068321 RepID=A0ABU0Z193_9MICO|nr:wax ester/triacylglycerol synthase domain-containing protein [Microbacterium sp. QXD-8]MDQ7878349.1 wax ester/triacylglycerol synthase family O-acyltransferase [Microbacterium sp. QXD-8]
MSAHTDLPRRAELISSLDEKYVSNAVTFAAMHAAGTMIVDGAPLRGPDGALDRAAIRRRVERLSWFAPAMRQRLVPTPLRLTTPAWVPVTSLDLDYHVRFADRVEPDDPARVERFTGRLSPTMDPTRPLWDFEFVELDSGRVAIVMRYHHVVGDAMYGLRIGDVIAGTAAMTEPPEPGEQQYLELGIPPRNGVEVLALAFAQWRSRQPGVRQAWRAYWRKSFRMRLRRWGGRLLRPVKNARIARTGLLADVREGRRSAYEAVDLAAATRRAYKLGGTVNDLVTAATLVAMARQRPDAETLSILVPISRRGAGDGVVRNDISVVKVVVAASAPLDQIVPSVRAQVQAAVDSGGSVVEGAEDWVGYATSVTWGRDDRFFGTAPVETVTGWPAGDPRDEVACLACSYRRELVVSVTARSSVDLPALMAVYRELLAPAPVAAGVPNGAPNGASAGVGPAAGMS